MYLSKIDLDIRAPSVRQGLRNCEDMHKNIQKCFGSARADAGVLYRLHRGGKGICVYLLSDSEPTAPVPGMIPEGCKDMTAYENALTEGRVFRFDLLCMPSKKVADGQKKNSRRINLRTPVERAAWLERKAAAGGFEILPDTLCETEERVVTGRKGDSELIFHATQFTGVLRITDEEAFRRTWREGIGPEKAYGLGMLMLMR